VLTQPDSRLVYIRDEKKMGHDLFAKIILLKRYNRGLKAGT
jgi:hypothetical protein